MVAKLARGRLPTIVEVAPLGDRRSIPAYLLIAAIALLGATAGLAGGFTFPRRTFLYDVIGLVAFAIFEASMFRRAGRHRLANAIETPILSAFMGFATSLAIVPFTAFSGPLSDDLLIRWDLALGYDWLSAYHAVAAHPLAMEILRNAYRSFVPESAGIFVLLCFLDHEDRAWRVVSATGISLLLTAILYPFFVADAAYNHFGIHYDDHFADIIHEILNGNRVISASKIGGLVTFPSFHVTAAVLVAWAGWVVRYLRWPLLLFNLVVCASAIFIGAHYFVDVIGGAAVAAIGIYCSGFTNRGPLQQKM
jgi:membrane-associated phospholipid phosphatase